MAERRMFSKTIIDSDAFLDMPQSSQLLYFHLAMRADDDGFINNPKSIMRNVKCNDDDLKLLIVKKFLIPFESGVVVIKHWRIHNYIRNDRYKETKYKEEKASLGLDENNAYTQSENCLVDKMDTNGIPVVYQMDTQYGDTQVRLGKDRLEIGEDRLCKDNIPPLSPSQMETGKEENRKDKSDNKNTIKKIIDYLNNKCGTRYRATTGNTIKSINARLSDGYTEDDFYTVIDKKCAEWIGTEWEKYLRPDTLFTPKHFEAYLNQNISRDKKKKSYAGISEMLSKETEEKLRSGDSSSDGSEFF